MNRKKLMQIENLKFPIINWILTVLIGPLIWFTYEIMCNGEGVLNMLSIVIPSWIFGLFFSLPTLVIQVVTFFLLLKYMNSVYLIRLFYLLTGTVMIALTFWWIGGSLVIPLFVSYASAFLLTGILIKVR